MYKSETIEVLSAPVFVSFREHLGCLIFRCLCHVMPFDRMKTDAFVKKLPFLLEAFVRVVYHS